MPKQSNHTYQASTAGGLGKCRGPLAMVVASAVELKRRGYPAFIKVESNPFPPIVFELTSSYEVIAVQIPWHLDTSNVEAHAEQIRSLINMREECA